jgi:hypothetical protein
MPTEERHVQPTVACRVIEEIPSQEQLWYPPTAALSPLPTNSYQYQPQEVLDLSDDVNLNPFQGLVATYGMYQVPTDFPRDRDRLRPMLLFCQRCLGSEICSSLPYLFPYAQLCPYSHTRKEIRFTYKCTLGNHKGTHLAQLSIEGTIREKLIIISGSIQPQDRPGRYEYGSLTCSNSPYIPTGESFWRRLRERDIDEFLRNREWNEYPSLRPRPPPYPYDVPSGRDSVICHSCRCREPTDNEPVSAACSGPWLSQTAYPASVPRYGSRSQITFEYRYPTWDKLNR